MKVVILVAFGLALSACASPAQLAVNDDAVCQSYGAKPGTDAYVQCRTSQQTQRTMIRAAVIASP